MSKILPEIHHKFRELTIEEVKEAYENGDTVTGFVDSISLEKEQVSILFGQDIMATMPFSEATIYPLRYSKRSQSKLPTNIKCLLKRKIRVKISSITADEIIVSRKKNMMEAYNHLQDCRQVSMYVTEVIPRTAFGDIGEGVTGKLFINDVCRNHIHNVGEYISERSTIDVVITGYDDEHRASVSYIKAFKPYCKEDYMVGDIIQVTIGDWIKVADTSAYYVSITPQVAGIMNVNRNLYLDYGSKAECVITGAGNKGLHLDFVKLI